MEVKPIEFEEFGQHWGSCQKRQATLAPALVVKNHPHAQYARGWFNLGTKP